MEATSHLFARNADRALANANLQKALSGLEDGRESRRKEAVESLGQDDFADLREEGVRIKNHTLLHLDLYLEAYEKAVIESGGHVHWARDAAEACKIVLDIAKRQDAKLVTKGKSMAGEEIDINAALQAEGIEALETDLGEYIVQIRNETPSHILAPAIHILPEEIAEDFRRHHQHLPEDRSLESGPAIVAEARTVLREEYQRADIGITGANFLIAETGQSIIVTNEGNGDLTQTLAKTHIVLAGIEKIVPTLADVSVILRILARSATGQTMSSYTSFSKGPARESDLDGPENYHVVLIDNGRTRMLNSECREILRCIRCGACMNVCPVYRAAGGHAYGWVYPGPMGSVLTPHFIGNKAVGTLPFASTLCGRCGDVCPMKIPLPNLLRKLRIQAHRTHISSMGERTGLWLWAFLAARPRLYRAVSHAANRILHMAGRKKGGFDWLPGASGWTNHRSFPAPSAASFSAAWGQGKRNWFPQPVTRNKESSRVK